MHRPACLVFAFLLVCSCSSGTATATEPSPVAVALCSRLGEIKHIPFKDESINDEVYTKLMEQGQAVVPCLIDQIANQTRMEDPDSVPSPPDFRVGDLAFFLLLDITKVPFEQMLPESVNNQAKEQGVYSYFAWVHNPAHRKRLQDKWRAWLKQQGRR